VRRKPGEYIALWLAIVLTAWFTVFVGDQIVGIVTR